MSSLEISVTNKKTGRVALHESFQVQDELAQAFIEQIEAMIAGLPSKQVSVTRTTGPRDETIVDIEINSNTFKPQLTHPTFEDLYRRCHPQLIGGVP